MYSSGQTISLQFENEKQQLSFGKMSSIPVFPNTCLSPRSDETSRERPKSAPYLRLKI